MSVLTMRTTPNLDIRTQNGQLVKTEPLVHYFEDIEYGVRLHNHTTKCFDYGIHLNEILTEDSKDGIFEKNDYK